MRYISIHKTNKDNEAGINPSPELVERMGQLIGEMAEAGIFVAGEGLGPSSKGVRVRYSNGRRTITKGPFTPSNELLAAFSIVTVKTIEEAVEWSSRFAPATGDVEIDVRPVHEPWDLGMMPKPEGTPTRYVLARKADRNTEAGGEVVPPDLDNVVRIQPSSKGIRLNFRGGQRKITDGPFAESKELIAGYVIFDVDSPDDLIPWITKFAAILGDVEVDVRPLYD